DRQRPLRDRVEESSVVRDKEHRSGERFERSFERLAALEVEMVRRLVDDEEVRSRRNDEREGQPAALAAREGDHRLLVLGPAGEEKPPEQLLCVWALQIGRALHALKHGAARIELQLLLREVRRNDAVTETHAPL